MPNTNAPAWKALEAHRDEVAGDHLREHFAVDSERFARFSIALDGLWVDFSKQRIDGEALRGTSNNARFSMNFAAQR